MTALLNNEHFGAVPRPTLLDSTSFSNGAGENIVKRFAAAVYARGACTAFRSRSLLASTAADGDNVEPCSVNAKWGTLSWTQYGEQVSLLASAFVGWGLQRGDRVAILSENRWEWHVADMAILALGAISVPIYPTSSASQIRYVLGDCGARWCVVSDEIQYRQVAAVQDQDSLLAHVLVMDAIAQPAAFLPTSNWAEAIESGAAQHQRNISVGELCEKISGDDIATIVYTSGTTGPPKGVILTHGNIAASVDMIQSLIGLFHRDRFLSFLPLSHIAERVVSHFGQIASGGETWFSRSFSTVSADIVDCRPTLFFAVPRVWEKLRDAFQIEEHRTSKLQRWLLRRYQTSNTELPQMAVRGRPHAICARIENVLLSKTVGRSLLKKLGLDQARGLFSGAAPIDPKLLVWLGTLGLNVGEVYGQTEACGPTTVSAPGAIRIGAVGRLLPDMESKIAEDGELLVWGANLCNGYFNNAVATAELFDTDGFMRTGDLARIDGDGYVWITGRKKDLMKTANGKYIAPQEIETRLRSLRFISNAMIIAEGRPFVSALVSLDAEAIGPWADHRGKPMSLEALALDPDVLNELAKGMATVNAEFNHAEQIKRWKILPRDLTLESGELTPTLKMVRSTVAKNFASAIEELYADVVNPTVGQSEHSK